MRRETPITDEEWRERLSPEQFRVCRQKGTEPPFSGRYHDHKGAGTYHCVCCGQRLFSATTKYDSGTGWPSFWDVADPAAVRIDVDRGWNMVRQEVVCSACNAHLGHLFDDGPAPTGNRYCINSVALRLSRDGAMG